MIETAPPYARAVSLRRIAGGLLILLALAAACFPLAQPVSAQTERGADRSFAPVVADWGRRLDRARQELRTPETPTARLEALREQLAILRGDAAGVRNDARTAIEDQQSLLDALGPAPKSDGPRETAAVAEQRRRIDAEMTIQQDRAKQSDLAAARADALIDEIGAELRRRIAAALLQRGPSPIGPDLWRKAGVEAVTASRAIASAPAEWWNSDGLLARASATAIELVLALVAIVGFGLWLRRYLLRRFGRDSTVTEPNHARRLLAALAEGVARTLVPIGILGAFHLVLATNELKRDPFGALLAAASLAAMTLLLVAGLNRAAFAPNRPAWRIIDCAPDAARVLARNFDLLGLLLALVVLFSGIAASGQVPVGGALANAVRIALVLSLAGVIIGLTDAGLWRGAEPATPGIGPAGGFWRNMRALARLIALVGVLALPFGFYNFAIFLVGNLIVSGLLIGLYLLLKRALRDALALLATSERPRIVRLRQNLGLGGAAAGQLRFWLGLALNLVLLVAVTTALLLAWGVPRGDIADAGGRLLRGVTIGNVTISLVDVILASAILVGGILATRFIQRGLEVRLMPQVHVDPGIRHSVVAGIGYAGYVLAALFAISILGLNLANLALIAGALSVGIGFGLQNIVNNFVSGLILLIERPVKVGDWVVVGDKEGYVKRINVRATEIETFPRAAVIIPNSELLSTAVMNWTHRDKLGRAEVTLSVPYGGDAEMVRDILLACVRGLPAIRPWPQPYVVLRELAPTSLNFAVRGFVDDVENRLFIESDLRFAIYRKLSEHGIDITIRPPEAAAKKRG